MRFLRTTLSASIALCVFACDGSQPETFATQEQYNGPVVTSKDAALSAHFRRDGWGLWSADGPLFFARWIGGSEGEKSSAVEPVFSRDQVVYERDKTLEWYRSTLRGIEHGLTIEEPVGDGRTLTWTWCIEGIASAELLDAASVVRLVSDQGVKLRIDRLEAWDDTGRPLPTAFSLREHMQCTEGVSYTLEVDARGATFPIEIDPTFQFEQVSIEVPEWGDRASRHPFLLDGDTLLIGAHKEATNAPRYGALFFHERHAGGTNAWGKTGELRPPSTFVHANSLYAYNITREGEWLALSVHKDPVSRSVWIYKQVNAQWLLHLVHSPSTSTMLELFEKERFYGTSALQMQNGVLAVGSELSSSTGAVYVYERDAGGPESWGLSTKLTPNDVRAGQSFGKRLSLANNKLAVAAGDYQNGTNRIGRVYVYARHNAGWQSEQILEPQSDGYFAQDVHLVGDTLYVSTFPTGVADLLAGDIEVYKRTGPPNLPWVYTGRISSSVPLPMARFGRRIVHDENTLYASASRTPLLPQQTQFEGMAGGVHVLYEDAAAQGGWSDVGEVLTFNYPRTAGPIADALEVSKRMVAITTLSETDAPDPDEDGRLYLFNTNQAPIVEDERLETPEDTSLAFVPTASDADGDSLEFRITSNVGHGKLEKTAGGFRYTPDENFHGIDGFSYQALDGFEPSQSAVVTLEVLSVEDRPVVTAQELRTNEDTPITTTLSASLPEEESQVIRFEITSPPLHGEVILDGDQVTYTPSPDYNGEDVFEFRAVANLASVPAKISVTIDAIPDAPRLPDLPETLEVNSGERLSYHVKVVEVDGEPTSLRLASSPPEGAAFLGGELTWTPTYEQLGQHEFVFEVSDGSESTNGALTIRVLAGDADGNGIADDEDLARGFDPFDGDDDGDGILDEEEVGDWEMPVDTDGDGTPDLLDTDSDDDGLEDGVDSCRTVPSLHPTDVDNDGIDDACDADIEYIEDFQDWRTPEKEQSGLGSRSCSITGFSRRRERSVPLCVFLGLLAVFTLVRRRLEARCDTHS